MFCDFGLEMNIPSLPSTSRLKSLELGAGALLDVSVYPLMYSNVLLDGKVGSEASDPEITSAMVLEYGIDVEDVIIVKYPRTKRVGVLTASLRTKTKEPFCRIEGSKGFITLDGPGTSLPRKVKIVVDGKEEVKEYNHEGMGFYFEADAVAMDILAGRKESDVIPLSETVRMMKVMDGIRRSGGLVYPQDE
jgi:dihydrodiol dehydrogenase / D-xylose 1-dehydrogenase (NADP)